MINIRKRTNFSYDDICAGSYKTEKVDNAYYVYSYDDFFIITNDFKKWRTVMVRFEIRFLLLNFS